MKVNEMEARVLPWVATKGDENHRVDYPLARESLVFDIGGYHGDWARDIDRLYGSRIKIFEPIRSFVKDLQAEFKDNDRITIYPIALGGSHRKELINIDWEASSVFKKGGHAEEITFDDIAKYVGADEIALMKMNIEGGEYELLDRLVQTGQINQIEAIQIQFHNFVPNASNKRKILQKNLAKTHSLTYCYPFVWESWKRNG